MALPCGAKPSVVVRFCPVLYKARSESDQDEMVEGETESGGGKEEEEGGYRMILAVATMDSVLLYETGSFGLVALLGGIHLATITDLSWSHDALTLAVSSRWA